MEEVKEGRVVDGERGLRRGERRGEGSKALGEGRWGGSRVPVGRWGDYGVCVCVLLVRARAKRESKYGVSVVTLLTASFVCSTCRSGVSLVQSLQE